MAVKLTLLEMVQDILSDMNSDEVNSINETTEALQVAQIIKSTYFELLDGKNWPHLRKLLPLDASGDNTRPVYMKVPELIKELEWIEYDCKKITETRDNWKTIRYVTPDEFVRRTSRYNSDSDDVVGITDFSGVKLLIKNNAAPEFYTSFDDEWVVFNSYDMLVDTTLQGSKTRCSAYVSPGWQMLDTFIPDLPSEMFSALLAEAKSTAFLYIKQAANQKAEQQAQRQRARMSRRAFQVAGGIRLPAYGRRPRK